MKMDGCCFTYCTIVCLITIRLFYTVNANANDEHVRTEMFKTKGSTRVLLTENTADVYSRSLISCANKCFTDPNCCLASYSIGTSTCRIDSSRSCCTETEPERRWRYIKRISYPYLPVTCPGCISFGCSSYSIIESHEQWEKENCEGLGGKLAELETSEENEFIKDELRTRNTGESGYWINGYNFYNDNDMEWVSQPNQTMTFSDNNPGQPDGPTTQLCMVMWTRFDFRWGDYECHNQISYICEFMHP